MKTTDPSTPVFTVKIASSARIRELERRIGAAAHLDEILLDLTEHVASILKVDQATIHLVDGIRRELVSRRKTADAIEEIRLPISNQSIAGCCAFNQKPLKTRHAGDPEAIAGGDPAPATLATPGESDPAAAGQVWVHPIIFNKYLLGVLELAVMDKEHAFSPEDDKVVAELADILGSALFNQKTQAIKRHKFDYLIENGRISQKELDAATELARKAKEPVEEILIKNYKVPKKEIGISLERHYGTPFVTFDPKMPIPGDLLTGLKVSFMRNNNWVPIRSEEGRIFVAIDNPRDLHRIDVIKTLFKNEPISLCVALRQDIREMIKHFTHDEKEMADIDQIISQMEGEAQEMEEAEHGVAESDSAVVQLVNKVILDASSRGASDIHIEPYPGKQSTQVRLRVDGNCYLYQTIPYNYRNAVVARIKIMSDLDISERRKPQDGKIRFKKYGGKDLELRVATVPTQGGLEDVVLRLLQAGDPIPLEKMAFSRRNMENFTRAIQQPYGIIFVCGPTGSGKTTTLHSALARINKPETKIWTAEDPVEITQAGLRQVQVQPKIGFDFAAAMRAFLRADPDVIMVGEMRDKETTHIGIEASLTGHLVFSTLHTNSAPESITRLLDMGMDPFNFADAILCILAQRLVLTLCKACKEPYHPTREQYDELVREYGKELFASNLNIPYTDDLTLYRPHGCGECNQTGYRGRMAIHELLMGTDAMKKLIQEKANMEKLRGQAIQDGMTTLKQDGIEKIFSGYCDLLQVRKVTIK